MLKSKKGFYVLEEFSQFPEVIHGFSTREFGDMKFGADSKEMVIKNRKRLAQTMGFDLKRTVEAEQVHGDKVALVDEKNLGQELPGADGLLTDARGIFLLIKTADCIPVLFYDPVQKIVGAVHAGWKGIVAKIGSKTVRLMKTEFGCQPRDVFVGLGPAIGRCCYSVPQERALKFKNFGKGIIWEREGKRYLDLEKALGQDLIGAGVLPGNIEVSRFCTSCQNKTFFSFRKEGRNLSGETAAVIGLKEKE